MGSQFFQRAGLFFYVTHLFCASSQASPVPSDFGQAEPKLGEFSLSELVVEDDLGYSCVPEDKIDAAFFASGKGIRLPQTCLPEPCEAALSEYQLANLIGRPASPSEWGDYFARYADVCRKEITPLKPEETAPAVREDSVAGFWEPLLADFVAPSVAAARTVLVPDPSPKSVLARDFGPLPPGSRRGSGGGTPGEPGTPPTVFEENEPKPGNPGGSQPLPVSLPAAIGMLLVAMCSFFTLKVRLTRN